MSPSTRPQYLHQKGKKSPLHKALHRAKKFRSTRSHGSSPRTYKVPRNKATRFPSTRLQSSLPQDYKVPLHKAAKFSSTRLQSFPPKNHRVPSTIPQGSPPENHKFPLYKTTRFPSTKPEGSSNKGPNFLNEETKHEIPFNKSTKTPLVRPYSILTSAQSSLHHQKEVLSTESHMSRILRDKFSFSMDVISVNRPQSLYAHTHRARKEGRFFIFFFFLESSF